MTEPAAVAATLSNPAPGLWHWWVQDERIQFRSDAYALESAERLVLVDPLPLAEACRAPWGAVSAVCLTGGVHQRSAWSFRKRHGCLVHAPCGAEKLEEEPDARFDAGDTLPGDLRVIAAPGPQGTGHALWSPRGALFVGDLLIRKEGEPLGLLPEPYLVDRAGAREALQRFLELPLRIVCPGHGPPVLQNAREAVEAVLSTL